MSEGYLVAAKLLGKVEHLFPPMPRAEKTLGLVCGYGLVERCGDDVQPNSKILAEV